MSKQQLATIDFHGDALSSVLVNGKPYVSVRSIADALGIDASNQIKKCKDRPRISSMVLITMEGVSGNNRKTCCIPANRVPWLLGTITRVSDELQGKLDLYLEGCAEVLAAYWLEGSAVRTPDGPKTLQQATAAGIENHPIVQALVQGILNGKENRQLTADLARAKQDKAALMRDLNQAETHMQLLTAPKAVHNITAVASSVGVGAVMLNAWLLAEKIIKKNDGAYALTHAFNMASPQLAHVTLVAKYDRNDGAPHRDETHVKSLRWTEAGRNFIISRFLEKVGRRLPVEDVGQYIRATQEGAVVWFKLKGLNGWTGTDGTARVFVLESMDKAYTPLRAEIRRAIAEDVARALPAGQGGGHV